MIAFYGSVKSYGALLEVCGFGSEAAAIQAAFKARDPDAMVAAVTEEMVDEFACAGTPAQVREGLRRFDGLVDEVALSPPSFRVSPERAGEILAGLIERADRGRAERRFRSAGSLWGRGRRLGSGSKTAAMKGWITPGPESPPPPSARPPPPPNRVLSEVGERRPSACTSSQSPISRTCKGGRAG